MNELKTTTPIRLTRNKVTHKLLLIVVGRVVWYTRGGFRITDLEMRPFKFTKLKDAVQYILIADYKGKS